MANKNRLQNEDTILGAQAYYDLTYLLSKSTYGKKLLTEEMQAEELEVFFEYLESKKAFENYIQFTKEKEVALEKWREEQKHQQELMLKYAFPQEKKSQIERPTTVALKELEAQIKQHQHMIKHYNQIIAATQQQLQQLQHRQVNNNRQFIQHAHQLNATIVNHLSGPNPPIFIGLNNQPMNNQEIINAQNHAMNNFPTPEKLLRVLGQEHPINHSSEQDSKLTYDANGMLIAPPLPVMKEYVVEDKTIALGLCLAMELRRVAKIAKRQLKAEGKPYSPVAVLKLINQNKEQFKELVDLQESFINAASGGIKEQRNINHEQRHHTFILEEVDQLNEEQKHELIQKLQEREAILSSQIEKGEQRMNQVNQNVHPKPVSQKRPTEQRKEKYHVVKIPGQKN